MLKLTMNVSDGVSRVTLSCCDHIIRECVDEDVVVRCDRCGVAYDRGEVKSLLDRARLELEHLQDALGL
jgi:Zn-finger nucleic acid-binding protein